jgi:hypothetical protein
MRKLAALLILLICTLFTTSMAQEVLPKFTVVTKGNKKVIISWTNNYPIVKQISIQRSKDSLRGFTSILSVADPTAQQNGIVDAKAPDEKQFYRLFIVQDSGKFVFSQSKRPILDTSKVVVTKPQQAAENAPRIIITEKVTPKQAEEIKEKLQPAEPAPAPVVKAPEPEKFFFIKKRDTLVATINAKEIKKFRDSVITKTKDTIAFAGGDTILLKPFVPKEIFKPSKFVFTEKDGNIRVNVPGAPLHHYSIKFFDEKYEFLFDVNELKEPIVLIDKVNFLRSGWYKFELFEDGKLKEKHKFFVPKD